MKQKDNQFAKLCRQIIDHLSHCDVFEKSEEDMLKLAKELLIAVSKPLD